MMDAQLLTVLLRDIALPEILAIIRAHHNATGQMPTNEQVLAAFDLDVTRIQASGQAFLDATRPK